MKPEQYDQLGMPHFLVGLTFTWLVGIARNWDFPQAPWYASLGFTSVAYIFFMAGMMWLSLRLPSVKRHPYFRFLTVVSMTAAPGLIYGIPVERFLSAADAQQANLIFLSVVAIWRVALFAHFAVKGCRMPLVHALLSMLTPIAAIIIAIHMTGRSEFVIELMGGLQPERQNSADYAANHLLSTLYCLSWPVLILGVFIQIISAASLTLNRPEYYRGFEKEDPEKNEHSGEAGEPKIGNE